MKTVVVVLALAALPATAEHIDPDPANIPPSYNGEADRAHLRHARTHLAARRNLELPRRPRVTARSRRTTSGGVWDLLAACEASGNPRAVSPSGLYRGLYQFDLETWRSVGMTGDPIDYPAAVQLEAAKRLHARRGWKPWPACAKKLGLL